MKDSSVEWGRFRNQREVEDGRMDRCQAGISPAYRVHQRNDLQSNLVITMEAIQANSIVVLSYRYIE
jgi:hypothetical protein